MKRSYLIALALGLVAAAVLLPLRKPAVRQVLLDRWLPEDDPTEVLVFEPPPATGPWHVGRETTVFRQDGVPGAAELPAWVYYPADERPTAGEAALPADWAAAYRPLLEREVGRAAATALLRARWPLRENAPAASLPLQFPVLVFLHGANQLPGSYVALSSDLASHGYVVVAFASPGLASLVLLQGGGNVPRESIQDETYELVAGQVAAVVGQLQVWNEETGHPLAHRLDLEKVVAIGHSVGGAAAVRALAKSAALRAAVNLDGDFMGAAATPPPARPVLYLTSQPPEAVGISWERWGEDPSEDRRDGVWGRLVGARADACRVRMESMFHGNFLDATLLPAPSMSASRRRRRFGPIDGRLGLELTSRIVRAYLARQVGIGPEKAARESWPTGDTLSHPEDRCLAQGPARAMPD